MFNIILILSVIVYCSASGGSYGGGSSASIYGATKGSTHVTNYGTPNIIPAAVVSKQTIQYRDVDIKRETLTPHIIEVNAGVIPLTILFKSASSALRVIQRHESFAGGEETTTSDDEPYRIFHKVNKPIIQEVREIISPYRRIVQEIQPVQEEVHTIVSRGKERDNGVTGYGTGVGIGKGVIGVYGGNTGVYGAASGSENKVYGDGISTAGSNVYSMSAGNGNELVMQMDIS